jgi:hypothetical protein
MVESPEGRSLKHRIPSFYESLVYLFHKDVLGKDVNILQKEARDKR